MNLELFLNSPCIINTWIAERSIQAYLRRSTRLLDKKMIECLDIASVEVTEGQRGYGIFTGFLVRFEEEAKKMNRAVFVESILHPRFAKFFYKRGYLQDPSSPDFVPNVYKLSLDIPPD